VIDVKQREYLKLVVRRMYDAQKLRIQSDLRMQRLIRDEIVLEAEAEAMLGKAQKLEAATETEYERIIRDLIRDIPVYDQWLAGVRGVGVRLSGLCIGLIGDIGKFANVSKLWAYAGLHVIDGKAARRTKGEKANWSDELKMTCWKISGSFVKCGGKYRTLLYEPYKQYLVVRELKNGNVIWKGSAAAGDGEEMPGVEIKPGKYKPAFVPKELLGTELVAPPKPEWTLARVNNMAMRRMAKIFLAHLWHVWREIEGLPTAGPYAMDRLGHASYLDPWKMMEDKAAEEAA